MATHFNYELATVEQIATHFQRASAQAVHSIRKRHRGKTLGEKLELAFVLMQQRKLEAQLQ